MTKHLPKIIHKVNKQLELSFADEGGHIESYEVAWQPTHISFAANGTNEAISFLVERTDDRGIVKFYIKGGA